MERNSFKPLALFSVLNKLRQTGDLDELFVKLVAGDSGELNTCMVFLLVVFLLLGAKGDGILAETGVLG